MAFNKMMAEFTQQVITRFPVSDAKVCELGNQTIKPDVEREYLVKTPREWYELFGFTDYLALDVNEYNDSIIADLNTILNVENIGGPFDLVTNNGTGEHIFNQYTVFANMHNLCRVNGIMIHVLPYDQADHGFYNYNPNLFACLAAANDYKPLCAWLGNSPLINYTEIELTLKRQTDLNRKHNLSSFDSNWGTSIAVAFKKQNDSEFKMPLQDLYAKGNADQSVLNKYDI